MPIEEEKARVPRRRKPTDAARLTLAERDLRSHARSLTELTKAVHQAGTTFSAAQMEQLKGVFSEALAEVGLRIDDPNHVDDAREDFRFLRRFRLSWDGAARKVGGMVLAAVVTVALGIVGLGFWAWIAKGGH